MASSDGGSDGDTAWVRQTVVALAALLGLVLLIAAPFVIAAAVTSALKASSWGSNK